MLAPNELSVYTLSEAWSGVNWADLMAVQGVRQVYQNDSMLWMEYRPVIKIGPKGALGSHEIRPIHSAPSLGQSIGSKCSHARAYGRIQNSISP